MPFCLELSEVGAYTELDFGGTSDFITWEGPLAPLDCLAGIRHLANVDKIIDVSDKIPSLQT